MAVSIIVEGKVLGQKRPLFADWLIDLPPIWERGGDHLKLRDLITRIVLEEVEAFQKRQAERRLARILTREQIVEGVERGKIESGERDLHQEVSPEAAAATALQAFEDGLYFVFVDDVQQEKLDSEVYLKPYSKVSFIRLVALAGG